MKKKAGVARDQAGKVGSFRQRDVQSIVTLNQFTNGWLGMFADAFSRATNPGSTITAAAIAYFSLFSLFPITLLSVAIASWSMGPSIDQHLILQKLEFIAPALGQLLGQNIDEIIKMRGPITAIALVGLFWSASEVFFTLTQTLNDIWGSKRRRPVWKRRGMAILFVLAFVGPVLFLASFASSLMTYMNTLLPNQILPVVNELSIFVAILLDISLFMLLYILLPHGTSTWHEILPGAITAGLLWEIAKRAFLIFVSSYISVSNLVYGSVSAIIAFLFWAYLSGIIFLLGANLSVAYYQHIQEQTETAEPG